MSKKYVCRAYGWGYMTKGLSVDGLRCLATAAAFFGLTLGASATMSGDRPRHVSELEVEHGG